MSIPSPIPSSRPFTVGIVGAGAFGRFMALHLQRLAPVCLHDTDARSVAIARWAGLSVVGLETVARCRIVILAVPLVALEAAARALAPHLAAGTTVVDVTSVKVRPLAILRRVLPNSARIVGLHPLFGPQSGAGGIVGMTVAQCHEGRPVDRLIARLLARRLGLNVVAVTAEDHDREMGQVQGLTHAIARTLRRLDLQPSCLPTRSYQHLLEMVGIVGGDSHGVFQTIVAANPHAGAAVRAFSRELDVVLREATADGRGAGVAM